MRGRSDNLAVAKKDFSQQAGVVAGIKSKPENFVFLRANVAIPSSGGFCEFRSRKELCWFGCRWHLTPSNRRSQPKSSNQTPTNADKGRF
jgi:hypothetical protein